MKVGVVLSKFQLFIDNNQLIQSSFKQKHLQGTSLRPDEVLLHLI